MISSNLLANRLLASRISESDEIVQTHDSLDFYRSVMDVFADHAAYRICVIVRSGMPTPRFVEVARQHCCGVVSTMVWPGTVIFENDATALWYNLNHQVQNLINDLSSFSEWLPPDYPEDLSVWTRDLEWIIGSVAHEKMVILNGRMASHEAYQEIKTIMYER